MEGTAGGDCEFAGAIAIDGWSGLTQRAVSDHTTRRLPLLGADFSTLFTEPWFTTRRFLHVSTTSHPVASPPVITGASNRMR